MAIYKKHISVGQFLKKGEDYKEGDMLEILDEGKQVEGNFGTQNVFQVRLENGVEGNVGFNTTSMNNMIDAYGEDSKRWIGRRVKVWAILSNVQGKMIKVYYFSHPLANINEDGEFFLSVSANENEDIPVVEE
jgi:hypothetical protein